MQSRTYEVIISSVMAPPTVEAIEKILTEATGDYVSVVEIKE